MKQHDIEGEGNEFSGVRCGALLAHCGKTHKIALTQTRLTSGRFSRQWVMLHSQAEALRLLEELTVLSNRPWVKTEELEDWE